MFFHLSFPMRNSVLSHFQKCFSQREILMALFCGIKYGNAWMVKPTLASKNNSTEGYYFQPTGKGLILFSIT